jgi:predicted phosphodiesterase
MSMRLAILSDVHGNLTALEAVLADLDACGPFNALGVAGDLCEWGPYPREALERVRALGCPVVQGNTDRYLTMGDAEELRALGKSDKAIRDLAWTRDQLGAAGVAYLAALPFAHTFAGPDGQDVLLVHANAIDQETHLAPDAAPEEVARLLGGTNASAVAFGHLHIPYTRSLDGRLLVDVASVGHPRDGDRRAAYAILEWGGAWRATIHRVASDLEAAAAAFRASGMPRPERSIKEMYRASYEHVE